VDNDDVVVDDDGAMVDDANGVSFSLHLDEEKLLLLGLCTLAF